MTALTDIDLLPPDVNIGQTGHEGWHDKIHSGLIAVKNLLITLDDAAVKKSGDQTITGTKTFSSPVVGATPTADSHLSTKLYVDQGLSGKTNTGHVHSIANITSLQTTLDGKASTVHSHSGQSISPSDINVVAMNYRATAYGNNTIFDAGSTGLFMGSAPFAREWNDLFSFNNRATPTFTSSTDGTTFTADTVDASVFANMRGASGTLLNGAARKSGRWTWASGMSWGPADYAFLVLNLPYQQATTANFTTLVESSADGTTWTTRHNSTVAKAQTILYLPVVSWGGDAQLRITITVNNAFLMRVSNMKMLIARPDQGSDNIGAPVLWDSNKKLAVGGSTTLTGSLNVGTNTLTAPGGIYFGTDTNFYRDGVGTLRSDGTITAQNMRAGLAPTDVTHLTRKDYVDSAISTAISTGVVKTTTDQTIAGVKSFTSAPKLKSTSTAGYAWVATGSDGSGDWSAIVNAPGGTVPWANITGRPSTFTPEAHVHAITDVTNLSSTLSGKVDTTRTVSAGTGLTGGGDLSANRTFAVVYGTTASSAAQGNDSRLSDTRIPTDLSVTTAKIADANITLPKLATTAKPYDISFVQSLDTRAVGYGEMLYGVRIPKAIVITSIRFRMGTADASGTTTCQLYSSATAAAANTAIAGTSGTAAIDPTAVTGSLSIAAGTYLYVYTSAIGTTPGKGLICDIEAYLA